MRHDEGQIELNGQHYEHGGCGRGVKGGYREKKKRSREEEKRKKWGNQCSWRYRLSVESVKLKRRTSVSSRKSYPQKSYSTLQTAIGRRKRILNGRTLGTVFNYFIHFPH